MMELTQPIATILAGICGGTIGGSLAILGVRWTIKATALRTLQEQLERRAKERERLLQDAYSEFMAIGYDLIETEIRLSDLYAIEEDSAAYAPKTLQSIDELHVARVRLQSSQLASMARIEIIDSGSSRILSMHRIYERIGTLNRNENNEELRNDAADYAIDIGDFGHEVAKSLDADYRYHAELAREGKYPPSVVKKPKGPPVC